MPKITGILETALYVQQLDRSIEFYQRIFGFPVIHREGDQMCGMAAAEKQILLLFTEGASVQATDTPGGRIPPHDGKGTLHLAFAIEASVIPAWKEHLAANGVSVESEVECGNGGHSIYFRDYDHHLLELMSPGCWSIY